MTDYNLHPYQRAAAAHVNGALKRHVIVVGGRRTGLAAALALQQMGRAPYRRIVSAARARTLRQRGEAVSYYGRTSTGKARYAWMPRRGAPQVLDHVPLIRRNMAEAMQASLDAHDKLMHKRIMAPPPTHFSGIAPRPIDRGYAWNPRTLDWDDVPPTTTGQREYNPAAANFTKPADVPMTITQGPK